MILQKVSEALSRDEILRIEQLVKATWPDPKISSFTDDDLLLDFKQRSSGRTSYLFYEQDMFVGYAETFPRSIETTQGPIDCLALATVCVKNEQRGKGIGAQIVQHIFQCIPSGDTRVCLFQTGVPEFYEKLNCKRIDNQFINSNNETNPDANPFWDPYVMIYPKSFNWPQGSVDLRGKGF